MCLITCIQRQNIKGACWHLANAEVAICRHLTLGCRTSFRTTLWACCATTNIKLEWRLKLPMLVLETSHHELVVPTYCGLLLCSSCSTVHKCWCACDAVNVKVRCYQESSSAPVSFAASSLVANSHAPNFSHACTHISFAETSLSSKLSSHTGILQYVS